MNVCIILAIFYINVVFLEKNITKINWLGNIIIEYISAIVQVYKMILFNQVVLCATKL